MLQPQPETVTLEDILITEELSRRNPRPANLLSENQALHKLARQLVNQPETMLQSIVDMALELCIAQSAGVSLLETTATGEEVFRWNVLAGELAQYVGGTTPRNFSPCGICLDRRTPQLYEYPDRYFTYLQAANTPIVEGLVLPLIAENHALGTIWIISQDEQRHFDSEDVRMMTSLADFTAAALLLKGRQTQESLAKNTQLETEIGERKRAEESARQSEAYLRAILLRSRFSSRRRYANANAMSSRASEERLRLASEAANFGTYEYIPQSDQINWSTTLKAIHGLPEDAEITFARLPEFIHPDDREQTLGKFQQFLSPDAPGAYEHEFRIVRTDGAVRWVLDKGRVFFTGEGEHRIATRVLGVTLDISERQAALHERKLKEAALHESELRLRVMIENLPGGAAFVVDRDLRYLLAEGEALSAAGFKREDLVGKTIFEAMPLELTPKYEELYRMALAGESFEHEHNAHDRTYISRGTPLHSANGEVYAVLAVSYDITDRKLAEATIAADLQDMQRLRELSARLVTEGDIQTLYQEIISTAIALMQADAGTVQILDEATQELLLLATQGFERNMTEHFYRVNASSNTPCGIALVRCDAFSSRGFANGNGFTERTFVDFDLSQSEDPDGSKRMHIEAGYLSAQSTPLIARSGKLIGMVSTHWHEQHRPSDRQLRFLDLLARQAADLIEQRQAEAALRESEEHFRAFVNASSNVVYKMSADWSVMHNLVGKQFIASTVNPKRNWLEEYIPEDEQPQVWAAIESAIRTKRNFELEHRIFRGDGTIGWTFSRAIPLLNEQGEIIEWFGAASNITDRKQAEVALRESEDKYRSLFTAMEQGFCIIEKVETAADQPSDFRYLTANRAFERHTGMHDVIGKTIRELVPDAEQRIMDLYDEVVRTGQPQQFEDYVSALDLWMEAEVFPSQIPSQIAVLFSNVSERKRAEAQLRRSAELDAFRVTLSDALRSLTDPVEIQAEACRLLGEHLGVDRAYYVEVNEAKSYARVNQEYLRGDSPSLVGVFRLADYGWTVPLLQRGETIIVADAENSDIIPEADREAMVAVRIAAHITIPLVKAGALVGALCVTESQPRQWLETEIELVRETAERIWAAIERAYAEAALRQSEEKYRSLFESIDEGYALCEVMYDENERPVDVRYLQVNPAFEQLSGLENVVGKTAVELNPIVESFWLETVAQVVQTGVATRVEEYAEGLNRWLDIYFSRVGGEGSRQIAVVFNDITERKRTEEQLRRAAEMDAFRVKLSDALRSLSDSVQIQAEASRLLGEYLDVDRAYYVEYDEVEGYTRVNQNYLRGDSPSLVGVYRLVDYGWTLPFLQRGEAIIVADAQTSDIIPEADRETMVTVKIAAHISIPLVKAGALVGSLCVTESVPRQWSAAEVELVRETAERIWATIIRARAETELRESEIQRVREQSAREEERQRAENLAELDRAKTLFFSNVSHEFRTPLTLLLAPLQDALSDSVNPLAQAQRERLELAHRNSLRLLKLVNTLLDFSRIEAGRMEAVYEPTDLAMFTTELASVFRSAIERAGLRLVVDCQPMRSPVYVDREMWEKIVLNLISNAFKFTQEGEIAVRLYVSDDNYVTLQVQDTGMGIAPEELPHLFERFYQVRSAKARTHEGSGIGLALVQELIRLHGGTIDVTSTPRVGSCFVVTIQLGTAHLPSDRLHRVVGDRITATRTLTSTALGAAPYVQEVERWLPQESAGRREAGEAGEADSETISADAKTISANSNTISANSNTISANSNTISANSETISANSNTISANSNTISANSETISANSETISANSNTKTAPPDHILVVDDNADIRDYLKRILSEHVKVEAVADGTTALAAATERVPDLILSDVMMPGLDGFELLRGLRADARTKEVPIILLSARAGEESVIEGLQAGADDYLIKPFSAQQLVTRVLAHLQMAKLRSETLRQEKTISRRKDEFIAKVSHELNTPLVAILGWTRLLRSSPSNQSMLTKSLETIERNATLQAKLIEDLLDISRITAGKISLNLQPVELQEVIEVAIATMYQSLKTKDIRLECTLDPLPTIVQADPDRLQQIVLNLLTNAVKFTPSRGRIEVCLEANQTQAQISVSDTGCGIDAEFLPYIFESFRQASGSKKGLGLGLAIARNLIELHGGTIHAQSPGIGQGATFIVKLPLI